MNPWTDHEAAQEEREDLRKSDHREDRERAEYNATLWTTRDLGIAITEAGRCQVKIGCCRRKGHKDALGCQAAPPLELYR